MNSRRRCVEARALPAGAGCRRGSANGPLGPAPDLPDPAGELARHGGVGPAGRLAGVRERLAAAVEPGGAGVGPRAYRRGHVGAGCGGLGPRGAHGVMPRGLYERRARERVAGLGYPAAPLGLAARVLRWREPAPAREGRRRAEPAEGPGLRRKPEGRQGVNPLDAGQRLHGRAPAVGARQRDDPPLELPLVRFRAAGGRDVVLERVALRPLEPDLGYPPPVGARPGPLPCPVGVALVLASIYFSPVSLNRRAVRAKAVSPVALTYFHRFRSRLDGTVPRQVLQPVGPARYLDQVAVVAHPVRDRARRHVIPEHPAPAADPHVGGDDRRALLVARRYQLEQQVRARAADVEVAELVDDQQPRVGVVLEPLLEDAARRGVLQVLDEPGAVHEPDLAPRPDRLDAQRDGEMRLAHAGAPHEQDVLGPLDEPQGRELLDLGARDRRLEVPVEVRQPLDVGEPRRPYALAGDPDLPGGDLDARHLLEGGGEAPLARGDHPHVVGQGRRHLVQPERGEVRLRPDRGAALRDGAHHAPPSESSSARLARAASAMSASARPRFPSRACP